MKSNTNLFLGIGLGVLAVLGVLLVVAPRVHAVSQANAEIGGFRKELAKTNAGPEAIAMLKERLRILEELGNDRITPIPDEPDLAGLMRRMSGMFSDAGIQPPQLTTGVPQPDKGAMSMPMTIVASGGFVSITEAIRSIEGLPRLVRVRRVRLATESDRRKGPVDRTGVVRADLLLDVFYGTSEVAEVDPR